MPRGPVVDYDAVSEPAFGGWLVVRRVATGRRFVAHLLKRSDGYLLLQNVGPELVARGGGRAAVGHHGR